MSPKYPIEYYRMSGPERSQYRADRAKTERDARNDAKSRRWETDRHYKVKEMAWIIQRLDRDRLLKRLEPIREAKGGEASVRKGVLYLVIDAMDLIDKRDKEIEHERDDA